MEKERTRKRKYYEKTSDLSAKKLKKRREEVLKRVRKHYGKKRENTEERAAEKLVLKFPFRSLGVRKKYRTALRGAYRQIEELKNENQQLKRRNKTIQKRVEREKQRSLEGNKVVTPLVPKEPSTPRSRTRRLMADNGFSTRQKKLVCKKLILADVLLEEVKNSVQGRKRKRAANIRVVSGQIIKKYRLASRLGNLTGVCRKSIRPESSESKVRKSIKNRYGNVVQNFLEREDNSTILPGKKDTVKEGTETKQRRVLSDYLHNLYDKFKLENNNIKISRTVFCRLRPSNFLTVSFCNRTKCLCIRHQNFAMKLHALRNQGGAVNVNPDSFVGGNKDDENIKSLIMKIPHDKITYTIWKKVDDGNKMRTKHVHMEKQKNDFISEFLKEYTEFKAHVARVKNQYGEMRKLRENLNDGHIIVWMDFAENYICSSMDEVQSAYWNASMVTLHTQVVYFPGSHSTSHMSIVGVSEVMLHNATAVNAMLKKLIPVIKMEYPDVHTIHYLSDSPTSQYRNKTVFNMLCAHREQYGIDATWDYLEAGHGKGPCDGLGASVKRSADMAVKQGKAHIQSAEDLYRWAANGNGSTIKYFYVSTQDYQQSQNEIQNLLVSSIAVPGTLKLHSVVPLSDNQRAVRDMSCHCSNCSTDLLTTDCPGWSFHYVKKLTEVEANGNENGNVEVGDNERGNGEETENADVEVRDSSRDLDEWPMVEPEKDCFVSAVYENEWYVGKVTDLDDSDDEALVDFMTMSGKTHSFKSPQQKDEIWVPRRNILQKLEDPVPYGKTKRTFKVSNIEEIENMFLLWKEFNKD